jgi:very-short-patch-repair endonuclease
MDQKERDFYRQNYLEERGWKFYRIDSLDWFNRKVDKKNDIINEILNEISGK